MELSLEVLHVAGRRWQVKVICSPSLLGRSVADLPNCTARDTLFTHPCFRVTGEKKRNKRVRSGNSCLVRLGYLHATSLLA